MSDRPVAIHCAAGSDAFADVVVVVQRKAGLVQVAAHPVFDLTPDDAEKLADALRDAAFRIQHAEMRAPRAVLEA
jgi:hypothetical protein